MDNEVKKQQNNLVQQFLEEYNQIKKVNAELQEKLEKNQSESQIILQKEKDAHKKTIQENQKFLKSLKDLKTEITSYEKKLLQKENENIELKKRLDQKCNLDEKTKERDGQLFQKFMGRKPITTNSQDEKLLTILNHYQNERDKLEKARDFLQKENDNFQQQITQLKEENNNFNQDEKYKNQRNIQIKDELIARIQKLEAEKQTLIKNFEQQQIQLNKSQNLYENINNKHENLKIQHKQLQLQIFQLEQQIQQQEQQQQKKHLNQNQKQNSNQKLNLENDSLLEDQEQQQILNFNQQELQVRQPLQDKTNKFLNEQNSVVNNIQNTTQSIQTNKSSIQKQFNNNCITIPLLNLKYARRSKSEDQLSQSVQLTQRQQIIPNLSMLPEQYQILREICNIYNVQDERFLIQCVQKTEQVIKAIPRLEKLIKQIYFVVFPNNQNNERIFSNQMNIENLIPTLQNWALSMQSLQYYQNLIEQISQQLFERKDASNTEIINELQNLKEKPKFFEQKFNQFEKLQSYSNLKVIDEFIKVMNIGPNDNITLKMNQLIIQLSDIQKFIKITKQLLELDEEMRAEVVLTYIIKLLEKMKLSKYNDTDLILKIQKTLKLDEPSQILQKIESIVKKKQLNQIPNK